MDDENLWLEDLVAADAAAWVAKQSATAVARYAADSAFTALHDSVEALLNDEERIADLQWHRGNLYQFWRDRHNVHGVWRRTTLDEYAKPTPSWQVILDLDALARAEGENWFWKDVEFLRGKDRCLVSLSRGGSDATVIREFDLTVGAFVTDGFALPEGKNWATWCDPESVYFGADFGPATLTGSGLPRNVRLWRRGAPLADSEVIFTAENNDVSVYAMRDSTGGFDYEFVHRWRDYYHGEGYLRSGDGALVRIEAPEDAEWAAWREWLVLRLRSAWTIGKVARAAGSLIATRLESFLRGGRDFTTLFEPTAQTTLHSWTWTESRLVLVVLTDVVAHIQLLQAASDGWSTTVLPNNGEPAHLEIMDTDTAGDIYLVKSVGFLRPPAAALGEGDRPLSMLRQEPDSFVTGGAVTRQFFATSDDGTRIPYFVVGKPSPSQQPTWLTGYGGFEHSETPTYDPVIGRFWIAEGHVYVVANIRGGGEYGPGWHQAALRENRTKAFEDFAAVAADLASRGITTPQMLGIEGLSNGGLLMGVMLTRFPDLFGAVIARMPLMDMRRYHLLHGGGSWLAEYGDPDSDDWGHLRRYSPYHNVRPGRRYPPALLLSSTRDDRVHPAHARKMTARLLANGHPVAYYESPDGGHGSGASSSQRAFVQALMIRFMKYHLTSGVAGNTRDC